MLRQEIFSVITFAYIIGLACISNFFLHRLVLNANKNQDNYNATTDRSFIAEKAYNNLKILNDYGPKVVGSDANERLAFNFIMNQVTEIKSSSQNHSEIMIDHQIVSGTNFVNNLYRNVQNIIVRVQGESNHAVMINCHYDSVSGSPGASDDSVMCCIMIEILRVLVKGSEKQKHSIIFLFNGAEEVNLQGAHGFITQHKWASDIRAYINLESTGSGGREILFRSGPKHDWLIRMYRKAAPRPFGQAVAEELFETGVIPSATDFEIFRDDGKLPGLDFAYVEEGFRYHTRYDSIDYITLKSIQHTGENIFALMIKIANSDELANPPEGSYAVYFDFLGLFMVSYSAEVGYVLNIVISLLAFSLPFIFHTSFKLKNIKAVAVETLISLFTIIISVALAGGACFGLAEIMNALDNTMSWFHSMFISIGIYCSLAALVQLATYNIVQFLKEKFISQRIYDEKNPISKRRKMQFQLNGINLFWTILTLIITFNGFRLGYITMVVLFISLCTNIILYILYKIALKTRTQSWIFLHLLGQSLVVVWISYLFQATWELFVPITAKQYYENPEVIIAIICTFWTVSSLSYFMPLTELAPKRATLYSILITCFVTSMILSFTSSGFPYRDNPDHPRLQRFKVYHSQRTFYSVSGEIEYSDFGFIIFETDRNARRTIESIFEENELSSLRDDPKCISHSFCGLPMIGMNRTNWLKGKITPPNIEATKVELLSVIRRDDDTNKVKVDFTLDLHTSTLVYMTSEPGWRLVQQNVPTKETVFNEKLVHFFQITYGLRTDGILRISFEFQRESSISTDNKFFITITVNTLTPTLWPNARTTEYKDLIDRFPSYTFVSELQTDSSTYIFGEV